MVRTRTSRATTSISKRSRGSCPSRGTATKDGGWLSVATVEPKFWQRMCELIGAPELSDRQFAEVAERPAIAETLAARFLERTLAEWEELFFAEKLPIAGVRRVPEVVRDPQVKARGLLPTVDVPGVGKL